MLKSDKLPVHINNRLSSKFIISKEQFRIVSFILFTREPGVQILKCAYYMNYFSIDN